MLAKRVGQRACGRLLSGDQELAAMAHRYAGIQPISLGAAQLLRLIPTLDTSLPNPTQARPTQAPSTSPTNRPLPAFPTTSAHTLQVHPGPHPRCLAGRGRKVGGATHNNGGAVCFILAGAGTGKRAQRAGH